MLMRQMEYYCAVCETMNFTKAAEMCFVSQSAISQQVKALEADLGVELLHRSGRSFTLTPAGEHFFHRARSILKDADDLRYETEGIANGYATSLAVGYLNRYEGWEVQGAVAAFAARHPHIEISTRAGSHDEIYRLMESGQVDMVFNDKRRSFSQDYVNRHLLTCWEYVEVSESSELAWKTELTVSELKSRSCILISSPEQEDVERAYYRDVLNFDCEFLFTRSREEGRMMVAGNRGFMPIETRDDETRSGSIVRRIPLFGEDGHISHEYFVFWLKARTNVLVEEFADVLAAAFERG